MNDVPVSSYDGTLERTADGGVIRFERRLPFPIRDVWDAITTPARLADWWLPFDADITVDLREGGEMVFAGRGDEPMTMTCTFLRIEPPMLLEHTHVDPNSRMRWELEAVETGCVLRVSHFVTELGRRYQVRCFEHRHAAGEKAAVIVHRFEFAVGHREDIRHTRMDARNRMHARLSFHDRRMQPSFEGRWMDAFDNFTAQIQGEKVGFLEQGETDARCHEEEIRIRQARADVAKALDQFLLRED